MQNRFDYLFNENNEFERNCREIFQWQIHQNPLYSTFCEELGRSQPATISDIPLLPIEAFRDTRVYAAGDHPPELVFTSSGTTGMLRSRHEVAYAHVYKSSIMAGLRRFLSLDNRTVLGYTPGYSENPNSSLIWMIQTLIASDPTRQSCFLPINVPPDTTRLREICASDEPVLLFGAAFGLLDLSEAITFPLPDGSVIMETGGMKTHKREISRKQLHRALAGVFGISEADVYSEYGMTELLSQSYATGGEWFTAQPWMQVSIRNPENPFETLPDGSEGLIGIIDLANWASCPFLLTGDLGVRRADGAFQVLGRWSKWHLRGCNFLMEVLQE